MPIKLILYELNFLFSTRISDAQLMRAKTPKINRNIPTQARSKETVKAILTATAQVLAREGFAKANTNRIAERAGVSIGSLYQYFPNKESLIARLMELHSLEISEKIHSKLHLPSKESFAEVVEAIINSAVETYVENPKLHQVLVRQTKIIEQSDTRLATEKQIIQDIEKYFQNQQTNLRPHNSNLAAFITVETIKSFTHAAALNQMNLFQMDEIKTEIGDLLLRYLTFRQ